MCHILAQFNFLKPLDLYNTEKPYWLFIGKPDSDPKVETTNVVTNMVTGIMVKDVRGYESEFTLDKQGFRFITHNQTFKSFDDEEKVKTEFLPEVERIIKDHVHSTSRVLVYDWRVSSEERSRRLRSALPC